MRSPKRILIIKMSAIGDVVHALPFLEVLRGNFPDARIDWLVEAEAAEIIAGHPAVDRTIISRRKGWQKKISGFKNWMPVVREVLVFLRELRGRHYDMVIDLQGLLRSGMLAGLSRGTRKIGLAGAREGGGFFMNERPVPVDQDAHAIDRYLRMAAHLGCTPMEWKGEIAVSAADRAWVDHLLNHNGISRRPIVAVNPMARWETKLWPLERFTALANRIVNDLEFDVVFTGGAGDRAVLDAVCAGTGGRALNLAGRTGLKQLAGLYTRCAVVVTTDTGPMHVAAATGAAVVALFGPTAPWRTGPYGSGHRVIRDETACSPCFKKQCAHPVCMERISVERVFSAVEDICGEAARTGKRD